MVEAPGFKSRLRTNATVAKRPRCAEIAPSSNLECSAPPFNPHPGAALTGEELKAERGLTMIRIVIDTVLFSCMGAFVTAIVVAARTLLS